MSEYLIGLLTIPAAAIVLAIAYAALRLAWFWCEEFLTRVPQFNKRVYAYKITSVTHTGRNRAADMIGSSIIERRNLGPTHDYRFTFDGTSWATLHATRVPGGGWFRGHQNNVDWDHGTVEELDRDIDRFL